MKGVEEEKEGQRRIERERTRRVWLGPCEKEIEKMEGEGKGERERRERERGVGPDQARLEQAGPE